MIARSLDTLTLRGGHLQAEGGGDDRFTPQDVTLRIGSATTVTEVDHPVTAPTIAAISVGSHITAFGTAGTDAGGKSTFDASTGHVRLEFTRLWGLLGTANPGQISVNLQAIDGQPVSVFNFAGTGVNPASDSKPANYQVLTGALPVTGLAPATPVALIGFVEPFNMAPPDFTARTLIDFATVSAELEVSFEPGTLMPFTMIDATGFVINLARPPPGSAHFIRVGPQLIDLTQLAASPRIVPDATGPDEFAIADAPATMMHGTIRTFSAYADFEMALVSALNGTNRVQLVESVGQYDQALNIFTARRIAVVLSH